jgi:uncharacterized protein (TIGR02271 family)
MDTNQRYAYSEDEASPYDRGTVAAIFDTRDQAAYALQDLHDAGFHKTWMGVTTATSASTASFDAEHEVESAEGGFGASLARFFGEDGRESLYDALTKRGVPSSDALALDNRIHDGGAVVTVEAKDRYDEVFTILRKDRGEIASTASGLGTATSAQAMSTAASDESPDARTLELREERLSIDKDRVAAGEATIGKRVVSQDASVDVPVMHEELFIQRRPVTSTRPATEPIGESETIRVPLMREQVVVDKRTVVREEVAIGKRSVSETQRVDETVSHEELVVDDGTGKSREAALK